MGQFEAPSAYRRIDSSAPTAGLGAIAIAAQSNKPCTLRASGLREAEVGARDRSQPAAITRIPIARVFREPSISLGLRDAVFGFRTLIYRARSSPNPD